MFGGYIQQTNAFNHAVIMVVLDGSEYYIIAIN